MEVKTIGEGEDRVQLPSEKQVDHLHAEEGEHQVQHSPEHHGDHLHAEQGRDKGSR